MRTSHTGTSQTDADNPGLNAKMPNTLAMKARH